MVKGTLNELSQLKISGFGQPAPRHGLNLLFWFSRDCIDINNGDIVPKIKPQQRVFGFHQYLNRIEDDDNLLPSQSHPYYEVGNLNAPGADKLPNYVRDNSRKPDGNKDRIIVRLDTRGNFDRVYITEHRDPKRFDGSKTYRVSQGLLKIIKDMKSQDEYLKLLHTGDQDQHLNFTEQSRSVGPPENNSWCTIL